MISLMAVSHFPDFDPRWTHEYEYSISPKVEK